MKPCPFCGSSDLNEAFDEGEAYIYCGNCWGQGPTFSYWHGDDQEEAIEKAKKGWNMPGRQTMNLGNSPDLECYKCKIKGKKNFDIPGIRFVFFKKDLFICDQCVALVLTGKIFEWSTEVAK